jgi:hypothetical protein
MNLIQRHQGFYVLTYQLNVEELEFYFHLKLNFKILINLHLQSIDNP